MTPRLFFVLATAPLAVIALVNLWVFGRFTVDDAFITWRHARNLIEAGVWAYNPSAFDATQAYTNPIFALAALVPVAVGWDLVFSFKLVSLAILAGVAGALVRLAADRPLAAFLLAALLAIPASVAHAVAGLETWLYGGALGLWFVAVERGAWRWALGLAALLVLTRPEAWLLYALHPLALAWAHLAPGPARPTRAEVLGQTLALAALAAGYFGLHLWLFGEVMPNTYFVKSGARLTAAGALKILPWALPVLAVLAFGNRRTGTLMAAYFGAVGISYAGSDLLMNYLERFPFQIVLPLAVYLVWAVTQAPSVPGRLPVWLGVMGLVAYLGAYAAATRNPVNLMTIANYWPRGLASYAPLGRTLAALGEAGRVGSFALGDAGVTAWHSRLPALDPIGLGSRLVTRQGATIETLRAYAPDVVMFVADADGIRDRPRWHDGMWAWVAEEGMSELCELYWAHQYAVRLYARTDIPELRAVCDASRAANPPDELTLFLRHVGQPPWAFWHD
jgi:hypothetical protein